MSTKSRYSTSDGLTLMLIIAERCRTLAERLPDGAARDKLIATAETFESRLRKHYSHAGVCGDGE